MTITNGLLTAAEYSAYTGATVPSDPSRAAQWDDAITVASRWVEKHTGRQFHETDTGVSPTPSARYYDAVGAFVHIDDCQSVTLVETDTGDDGTYATTVASTQYQALPLGRDPLLGAVPYMTLKALSWNVWPCGNDREGSVKVTGLWGWTAVPDDVKRATAILAQDLLRDAQANFGGLTVSGDGIVLGSRIPTRVLGLLAAYRRMDRVMGIA